MAQWKTESHYMKRVKPMKDEAPHVMQLAIPVKLRATNQIARCTTPLLISFHTLWCEKMWWKLGDGQRWMGVKRRSNNVLNERWPSEKPNLVLSKESTPTKDEAQQLMRLVILVYLRGTNQIARCTTPLLISFPALWFEKNVMKIRWWLEMDGSQEE